MRGFRARDATPALCLAITLCAVFTTSAQDVNFLYRIKELGLQNIDGKIPAYYSAGHKEHAQRLQSRIEDMNAYFQAHLGVQANVVLALLDSKGWTAVTGAPYGIAMVNGNPLVIFMPATSDNPTFGLIRARKEAIPPETLRLFLQDNQIPFESAVSQFVDLVGFHELGHVLTLNFGIDPQGRFLSEFLASYWSYAYISERQPEWRRVFDLFGRPSKIRPQHTSLEDFEHLYMRVDDPGWYHGMFEAHIREIYPKLGLSFLSGLRKEFPLSGDPLAYTPPERRPQVGEVIERLDKIAPGFQAWAATFNSAPAPAGLQPSGAGPAPSSKSPH
jgi:hypothetical protein